jgi:hypothetical protein
VSCAEVPVRWRRAIALAVPLPARRRARALRWDDVDLEHGTVHVHQAFDRRARHTSGEVDEDEDEDLASVHSDIATTMIDVRTAEAIGDAFGDVFPPFPPLVAPPPTPALPVISTGPLLDQRRASTQDRGAGHGIRTRDIQLGKLALYQLS